ncbi:thiol-activated cytolysin family protein [Chitinophaga sp. OAE865]|uniref:thiol-activated cytolysin family protein n=1 Tax=Chitinophaga sp. OAE865 TaxID=2817898 RepID=UPI001AE1E4AC
MYHRYVFLISVALTMFFLTSCQKKTIDKEGYNRQNTWLMAMVQPPATATEGPRIRQYVTDENSDFIYLGAILNGQELIQNESYIPIGSYTKLPIVITGTFNAKAMAGTILERPRLSTYRQKIRDLFYEDPTIIQSGSFEYSYRPFTNYDSLNNEFATSKKTSKFFSSSSSSITNTEKSISKQTGLVLQFIQTYYSTTTNLPRANELLSKISIDSMVAAHMDPVYINSITYGRMGVITVESNYSYEELSSVYSSVTKKLFKKMTETVTKHEIDVINESIIRIYIIGGSGSSGALSVIGYNSLSSIITSGDIQPSVDNPGVPIFFSMRYLKNFSPVTFLY